MLGLGFELGLVFSVRDSVSVNARVTISVRV